MLVSSLAQFSDGDSLCSPVSVNMIAHMESQERENPSDGEEVAAQDGMLAGTISFRAERLALGKDLVARDQQDLSEDWAPLCMN